MPQMKSEKGKFAIPLSVVLIKLILAIILLISSIQHVL